jgi:hypothetical protein
VGRYDVIAWSFGDAYGPCGGGFLCPECAAKLCGSLDWSMGLPRCSKYGDISPVFEAERPAVPRGSRCSECGRLI